MTAAPRHRRPRRPVRHGLPLRAYLLNAAAIVIAVLLIPALSRSSATEAVPRTDPVVAPSSVPVDQLRYGADVPPPAINRNATRDGLDHDDTVPPPAPTRVAANGTGFVSPVPGAITGAFGQRFHPILHYWRMHNGVDMHAACGTVVVAAYRGKVVDAGWNGGYGNLVVVDHGRYKGKHVISKYAHLSRIGVRVGDRVRTGQGLALSGTTGLSTGCHLHFEIKENGGYVDPAPYLTGKTSPRPKGPIVDLGPTTAPNASASASPTPTASPRPTDTARPTASPSHTPKPTPSPSITTARPSPSPSTTPPTATPSPTPTEPDPEPSETPSPTPTPTPTPTRSSTPTPTPTRSSTPTPTATARESSTPKQPTPTTSAKAPSPSASPSEKESATPSPRASETERSRPSTAASPSASATP